MEVIDSRTAVSFIANRKPLLWFLVLQAMDVITTRIGVSIGATESNFIVSDLGLSIGDFLWIKSAVVLLLAYEIGIRGINSKILGCLLFGTLSLVVVLNILRIATLLLIPELDGVLWL